MIVLAYDYTAYLIAGYDATITAVIRRWQQNFPELAYVVASLMLWLWLHLFFEGFVRARQ